ncbi:hypothetical protein Tco_0286120 [Tanacetum coccineum]
MKFMKLDLLSVAGSPGIMASKDIGAYLLLFELNVNGEYFQPVNIGFSDQVVELYFLYPSESIHKRWDNGYRITSIAATCDQTALILSVPHRTPDDETQETLLPCLDDIAKGEKVHDRRKDSSEPAGLSINGPSIAATPYIRRISLRFVAVFIFSNVVLVFKWVAAIVFGSVVQKHNSSSKKDNGDSDNIMISCKLFCFALTEVPQFLYAKGLSNRSLFQDKKDEGDKYSALAVFKTKQEAD